MSEHRANNAPEPSRSVFRRGGQKAEISFADESVDYEAIAHTKLAELLELWSQPRTGCHLSAAVWRPDHCLAEVVVQRTKLLDRMGFIHRGRMFLCPEEAVYLMDRGDLLLVVELDASLGRPLTMAEALELLSDCGVPMSAFRVYGHLRRGGYAVVRHPACWMLPPSALLPKATWGVALAPPMDADRGAVCPMDASTLQQGSSTPSATADMLEPFAALAVPVQGDALSVSFDVYAPNPSVPFSKKTPPRPDFSVCLASHVPSLGQLQALRSGMHPDDPPIKFGYTDQGDVGFLELHLD